MKYFPLQPHYTVNIQSCAYHTYANKKERLRDIAEVRERVREWQDKRNSQRPTIHWRFTAHDARIKLSRLYLCIEA